MAQQAAAPARFPAVRRRSWRSPARSRAQGIGVLFALLTVLFGPAAPGLGATAEAAAQAGTSAAAEKHSGSHGDTACTSSAEAAPPYFYRDTGAQRHAAHPGGDAAVCGSVYVPRPRPQVRHIPAAPVADADHLRAAGRLGRDPPPPPGI